MKLDVKAIGIAAGNVAAVAFIVCGLFFRIAPEFAGRFFDFLLHSNMETMWRVPGWGALVGGAVGWWVLTAVCAGATAALYNRTTRN
jgi:2TM family of unknown function (DUF5676)